MIRGMQENTKIGRDRKIQETALDMIEAMVQSELVFHGANLQVMALFLLQLDLS